MRMETWISAAALAALACMAPGCGAGEVAARPAPGAVASPTEAPQPPASHSAPMVALPTELPEGRVEVLAIVMKEGKAGVAERPFERGHLVAIPAERFDAFQAGATGTWKGNVLEGSGFPLPDELLKEPDVSSAALQQDGTCTLIMPPGDYRICLGNVGLADDRLQDAGVRGKNVKDDVIVVQGCLEITVTGEEFQTLVLSLDRRTGRIARLD